MFIAFNYIPRTYNLHDNKIQILLKLKRIA